MLGGVLHRDPQTAYGLRVEGFCRDVEGYG